MISPKLQSTVVAAFIVGLALFIPACQNNPMNPPSMKSIGNTMPRMGTASINGSAGDMPAYYDAHLFTINFAMLSPSAAAATLAQNKSINIIYRSDATLPGNQPFISVPNAIQGDGFNPLWQEVDVVFNAGVTPHQFFSDNDVISAADTSRPEITLDTTNEIYRCSVVGPK